MSRRRMQIALAVAGIGIEIVAIALLASKVITPTFAVPLIIAGMFLAFVPLFGAARARRP